MYLTAIMNHFINKTIMKKGNPTIFNLAHQNILLFFYCLLFLLKPYISVESNIHV